ncbi:MAG TPA: biotin--[acetyl-CoA-carboxylase] ligase [Planctomycetota bacterium]|nr:biotin--[acetyl-CoA-carboxylase] ligase [Planctomycetota bacterium]
MRDFSIEVFDVLGSTNDGILEAGRTDRPEGTTYIALSQSRGRGRGSHVWWSPPGAGLWMSTLLRPSTRPSQWGGISLLAGTAVRDALVSLGVPGVRLYWPNDLQAGRRKIGGILGEVRSQGPRAWIALGIGVNIDFTPAHVRAAMPADIGAIATSMTECGHPTTTDPVAIARTILETLWPLYERFQAGEPLSSLVESGLAHVGSEVEVRAPAGAPWRGRVEGLGSGGELLVRPLAPEGAVVPITGGEVVYDPED